MTQKEKLDIHPGPKLVKTADLQARFELVDRLFSLLLKHLFSKLWSSLNFSLISNESTKIHEKYLLFLGTVS